MVFEGMDSFWRKVADALQDLGPDPGDALCLSQESPSGLTNPGATCYVNNVLQCLYMNSTAGWSGVSEAATYITGESACDIGLFMAQNVFRGTFSYVIKCSKCGQESDASKEAVDFYELELNLKGFSSLEESLNNYLSEEELPGENQWLCEGFQMHVDATHCTKLHFLPPVLNFQLKRFVFNAKEFSEIVKHSNNSKDAHGQELCSKAEQILQQLDAQVDPAIACSTMLKFFAVSGVDKKTTRDALEEAHAVLQTYDAELEEKRQEAAELQQDCQIPGMSNPMSGIFPSMFPFAEGTQEMRFLGMTEEEMRHPLVPSLVELWPDYNDFYIDLDNLAHPLVKDIPEEATEKLCMIPGLEDLLSLISSHQFVDVAGNVELGVPITVEQLRQLHPFLHQVVMAQQLAIIKRPKYCQLTMVWSVLILAPTLLDTKQTLLTPYADSNGKKTHNLQIVTKRAHKIINSEKQHGKSLISAKVANSLDRWIRFTDLVGDHAGLVVIQSLSDTMSNMLKMAASSHTLLKQLSVEALLEQATKWIWLCIQSN
ncbi:unnamed protein product [Sphagnum balticum]